MTTAYQEVFKDQPKIKLGIRYKSDFPIIFQDNGEVDRQATMEQHTQSIHNTFFQSWVQARAITAYKEEEEVIVEGIHEPIITKALFLKAQNFLNNRRKNHHVIHKKLNETYPLKGFLLCPLCNTPLTGSTSKGRSKYYSYYHCISPCKGRYQLEDVNLWFGDYLNSITLNAASKKLFEEMIVEAINIEKDKKMLGPKHYERVNQIEVKMQRLQDLYIDGEMDKKEYEIVKKRYQNIYDELKELEIEVVDEKEVLK
jgi:hypothetical protein